MILWKITQKKNAKIKMAPGMSIFQINDFRDKILVAETKL